MCWTPQLSLSGTHVTMHGCDRSRSTTSVHSATIRFTAAGLNSKALGVSPQTSRPEGSAQNRKRGSSIFWCTRAALNPRSLISCASAPQGVGGRAGEVGLRPVALAEHRTHVVRPVVEQEHALVHGRGTQPEVGVDGVDVAGRLVVGLQDDDGVEQAGVLG